MHRDHTWCIAKFSQRRHKACSKATIKQVVCDRTQSCRRKLLSEFMDGMRALHQATLIITQSREGRPITTQLTEHPLIENELFTAEAGDLAIASVPARLATACCCWCVRCRRKGRKDASIIIAMNTASQDSNEIPRVMHTTCRSATCN